MEEMKIISDKTLDISNSFKIPKNIRQVGQPPIDEKIFIEDYVVTYIRQSSKWMNEGRDIHILLGKIIGENDEKIVCINGVVDIELDYMDSEYTLTDSKLNEIKAKIDKHYGKISIVGWSVARSGMGMPDDYIIKVHLANFMNNNILLVYDTFEKEEIFYRYGASSLNRLSGFYVYYDRNESMQNYMLMIKGNKSIEYGYSEEVMPKIRKTLQEKQNKNSWSTYIDSNTKKKKKSNGKYVAAMLVVTAVLGVTAFKIDDIERIAKQKAQSAMVKAEQIKSNSSDYFVIDTINGGREKLEDLVTTEKPSMNPSKTKMPATKAAETKAPATKSPETKAPATKAPTTKSPETKAPAKKKPTKSYVVKKGDSLEVISKKMYGSIAGIDKITKANDLKNADVISIGQKLIIP